MHYKTILDATFLSRLNRFIAKVLLDGKEETVHVKNTGRCKELLLPGADVRLEASDNPARKTKYDLVAVRKEGLGWVNIDSQAPNKVVKEWLETQGFDAIYPEFSYGKSRIDFAMEKAGQIYLLEVKGCTLEVNGIGYFPDAPTVEVKGCTLGVNGIGYFPDAPTERGVKHLQELTQAQQTGVRCGVAFVIQMEGITEVRPNVAAHPAFGEALALAKAAGVKVFFLLCRVGRDSLDIVDQREG